MTQATTPYSKLWRILGLVGCLALVAAACSSSGDDAGDAESATATSVAEEASASSTAPTSTAPTPTTATPTTAAPTTTVAETPANAGAPGIGDDRYPLAGNGGYDVESYGLDLTWDQPTAFLDAVATISLTTTEQLESFNLDLIGMDVGSVTVDGAEAPFSRDGQELTVLLADLVPADTALEVVVAYSGTPGSMNNGIAEIGWRFDGTTVVALGEPDGAAYWYPVNDHPSDKASYRFTVTADAELTVAANGTAEPAIDNGDGTSTWVYVGEGEQAPHATILAIGEYELVEGGEVDGVRIRHFLSPSVVGPARAELEGTADDLRRMTELLGPYPFDTYGYLTVEGAFPGALETQTLTAIGADLIGPEIRRHELAHAWFGNYISISNWDDLWLAEGFATFFSDAPYQEPMTQEEFGEQLGFLAQQSAGGIDAAPFAPAEGIFELFGQSTYVRGSLVLQALRFKVGEDLFYETMRAYIDAHGGGVASTDDFVAVATETTGQDLTDLFDVWLFNQGLPTEWEGINLGSPDGGGGAETIGELFPGSTVECLAEFGLDPDTLLLDLTPEDEAAFLECT